MQAYPNIALLWMTLVGAALGSFAGLVVDRLPRGASIVRPPSHCDACGARLPWFCNVPLVSFLLLRGRALCCGAKLAPRLWLCEALCAALCAALWVRFGISFALLQWVPLTWALLVITFLDIDHYWVPDVLTLPALLWAFVTALLPGRPGIVSAASGLLPALLLWGVGWAYERLRRQEGMGLGDVKLLAMLGLAVGGVNAWVLLILAATQGAIVGSIVVCCGGHRSVAAATAPMPDEDGWEPPAHAVPFGPFLALAALQVVLLPHVFADWHLRLADLVARFV